MEISLENLCVDIGVLWVNFFFQVMMPWIKLLSQVRRMKTFKDILKLLGGLSPLQEIS